MKNKISLIVAGCTLFFSASAFSANDCAIKREKIKDQMEYAKKNNNSNQLARLQKALNHVEANCGLSVNSNKKGNRKRAMHHNDVRKEFDNLSDSEKRALKEKMEARRKEFDNLSDSEKRALREKMEARRKEFDNLSDSEKRALREKMEAHRKEFDNLSDSEKRALRKKMEDYRKGFDKNLTDAERKITNDLYDSIYSD